MMQPLSYRHQVRALRLPLVMATVAALLFILPAQTREIYRALAQSSVQTNWANVNGSEQIVLELALAAIGVILFSTAIWFTARRAASMFEIGPRSGSDVSTITDFTTRPWLLLWLPRLLVLAVPLSIAFGIVLSDVQPGFVERVKGAMVDVFKLQVEHLGLSDRAATRIANREASKILSFSTHLTYGAAFLLAGAGVLFGIIFALDRPWLARRLVKPRRRNMYVTGAIGLAAFTVIIVTVLGSPVAIPQLVGALFIMSLFLTTMLLILFQLRLWRQRTGIPFVSMLLASALLFAVFDLNDNHSIRSLPDAPQESRRDQGLPRAFERWLSSRADADQYIGKPYPVYIVAAQGGGIYAASHAASFLADVQDLCPGFGHHLFAISGVSGGSVGASIFSALTQDVDWAAKGNAGKFRCVEDIAGERPTPFRFATTSTFRQDLWSPLAASLLFPDFLQRFIFYPFHSWDRGRALELAIEKAYDKGLVESEFLAADVASKRPLSSSYMNHWNPEKNTHTPALLLNTTEVGSGKRRVVSPFSFDGVGLDFLPVWASRADGRKSTAPLNPLLSTAAGLSARFPWLTPTAHFYETDGESGSPDTRKVRIADGAYFENSGVVTAIDLIKSIVKTARAEGIQQEIEIHLLVFTSAEFDVGGSLGLGEMMDPLRTMFNARAARAGIAVDEALETLNTLSVVSPNVKVDMIKLELNGYGYPLPLGWRLSPLTEHLISFHNGSERFCTSEQAASTTAANSIRNASCAKRRIYDRLK